MIGGGELLPVLLLVVGGRCAFSASVSVAPRWPPCIDTLNISPVGPSLVFFAFFLQVG